MGERGRGAAWTPLRARVGSGSPAWGDCRRPGPFTGLAEQGKAVHGAALQPGPAGTGGEGAAVMRVMGACGPGGRLRGERR